MASSPPDRLHHCPPHQLDSALIASLGLDDSFDGNSSLADLEYPHPDGCTPTKGCNYGRPHPVLLPFHLPKELVLFQFRPINEWFIGLPTCVPIFEVSLSPGSPDMPAMNIRYTSVDCTLGVATAHWTPASGNISVCLSDNTAREYETGLDVVVMKPTCEIFDNVVYPFQIMLDKHSNGETGLECFEWRSSQSWVVQEFADGEAAGYELFWLGGKKQPGVDDEKTGDSQEVVAAVVRLTPSEYDQYESERIRFTFLGTGQSGSFGERWRLMALVTGMAVAEKGGEKPRECWGPCVGA